MTIDLISVTKVQGQLQDEMYASANYHTNIYSSSTFKDYKGGLRIEIKPAQANFLTVYNGMVKNQGFLSYLEDVTDVEVPLEANPENYYVYNRVDQTQTPESIIIISKTPPTLNQNIMKNWGTGKNDFLLATFTITSSGIIDLKSVANEELPASDVGFLRVDGQLTLDANGLLNNNDNLYFDQIGRELQKASSPDVLLGFGGSTIIPEFSNIHPYDLGYRNIFVTLEGGVKTTVPLLNASNSFFPSASLSSTEGTTAMAFNYSYYITRTGSSFKFNNGAVFNANGVALARLLVTKIEFTR